MRATAAQEPADSDGRSALRIQQLRGIFAAFDENRDGVLTKTELANALLSLGVNPTHKVVQRYQVGTTSGEVDLPTFIRVSMRRLDDADRTVGQISRVFQEFDSADSGSVTTATLRHLLNEVLTQSQLSNEETEELLRYTGISAMSQAGLGDTVEYDRFVKKMLF
jgi:Ca2+-binding EF-hand superfamily protein